MVEAITLQPTLDPFALDNAEVTCQLTFGVDDHAALALQVAVASSSGSTEVEELDVRLDGRPVGVEVLEVETGGRVHLVRCGAGLLTTSYRAVLRRAAPEPRPLSPAEHLLALRQSRYCPSDALTAFAEAELSGLLTDGAPGQAIGDWVFERLRYELGSSGPLDTAVDSLLKGAGVCRDFAHLTIALCRAVGIPARLASVYAPGLSPMDFHAVAEVAIDDTGWQIIDATRLAPRSSLIRIATGRDAADTAFATTIDGSVELLASFITATTDGLLPADDHDEMVALA